ncbi:Eco57I restriction-modification methylase domain-containing protein [Romboutsia sp. 1001713B170207_170306_H8]|uniref:Eco57I restriction-modification methylase domain-containing protein n=1 Tax=Romboutsia sp. 1001713B170207_170306_H8 TaxID=2787112 RepID=UPI00189AB84A|nr:Eco57I restriction-modification methylase domain-containing protein [Romboutsia sp. 1001713B170207_170306_H8]
MSSTIINIFEESQNKYLETKDKSYLKDKSQFFTPYDTACKMISTIDFNIFRNSDTLFILEPSGGCGILIASLILHIINTCSNIKNIHVDAYEFDIDVSNILYDNLNILAKYVNKTSSIKFSYNILNENFITKNKNEWIKSNDHGKYDIIISNPPYKKINQSSDEAIVMSNIVYGQPNIYTLFIAMSLKLLKQNGVYILLSPRNYLSGEYSKKLRKFIFSNYSLTNIHSFEKRSMFKSVNQEVIISTFINNKKHNKVNISFNDSSDFSINFDDIIFDKDSMSILVPRTINDIALLKNIKTLKYTLNDLGLKVSVGPIVQFRNENDIKKDTYTDDYAPLLISADIQPNNKICYFDRENKRKTHNKSIYNKNRWLVKNSNYLLIRKVTAKDDIDLIVTSVLDKNYFNHDFIGFDNNLLYLHSIDKSEMEISLCYGLYCFMNSKQFKEFYFSINGTHTINVTDFNNIKFPDIDTLSKLGTSIMNSDYSEITCSILVEKYLEIH